MPFTKKMEEVSHIEIQIKGLVQGVGFRPFIYNLANKKKIKGWVKNHTNGVTILASAKENTLTEFQHEIMEKAPSASHIESFSFTQTKPAVHKSFQILQSKKIKSQSITQIGPDIATCPDCLVDIKAQVERLNYPFTNCTNCGPRFSIVKHLPYDRSRTTMEKFQMCSFCSNEYQEPKNRRFHAQPIACNSCGPSYKMHFQNEKITDFQTILKYTSQIIDHGQIVAIKGLGGYFLASDALNPTAIFNLRQKKHRESKPLAVMMKDISTVKEFCHLPVEEEKVLNSWRKPIVLLRGKGKLHPSVSSSLNKQGVMLPYMPFHHLLFEQLNTPAIIFTSGNLSNKPIIKKNKKALANLLPISMAIVSNNRKISNRVDDSLVQVINKKTRILRRSRGYAPNPIKLQLNTNNIVALGAELKNTFCIGRGNNAILSQHIGDLKDDTTLNFYKKNINQFIKMFQVKPDLLVTDLHPDYFSTTYATELDLPTIKVQHHHAHIASCMAEHDLDEEVIGISFDGTGHGDDGNIWGSEFFICDLEKYKRIKHFEYLPMPGGDLCATEPWRMGISYLYHVFGDKLIDLKLPVLQEIPREKIKWVIKAIKGNLNCTLTSSSGRLFDAISSILGLCFHSSFEAEAPMRLENILHPGIISHYPFDTENQISFQECLMGVVKDFQKGIPPSIISTKFHNTIVEVICETAYEIRKGYACNKVVLSGGTFQNKYVLENVENKLLKNNFQVYSHSKVPSNDGGIALGQLAIAAKKRSPHPNLPPKGEGEVSNVQIKNNQ